MASIDSGVDTENESSDSNFTSENSKTSEDSKDAMSEIQPQPQVSSPEKEQDTIFAPFTQIHTVFGEPIWFSKTCLLEPSPAFGKSNIFTVSEHPYSYYAYLGEEHQNKLSLRQVCKKRYQILRFHTKKHEISNILAEKRLRLAASLNHVEAVKRLLRAGVNPRSSDDKRRTALHIAACKGYLDIVELLLEGGADPNQKDAVGNTALHVAAYTNHFKVILQLLRATAANLHKVDESGCKLLRIAQTRMLGFLKESNPTICENNFSRTEIEESLKILDVIFKHCHEKAEADLISGFSNRLNLKQSKDEGENTIQDVLSSLSELTLQKKV